MVAVDTLAKDALSGRASPWAKLLLIPQHNPILATRGSTQFFLRVYELALQVIYRADFRMEHLMRELGLVIDQLWPNYECGALAASPHKGPLRTQLALGGWSPQNEQFMATACVNSDGSRPTEI